MPVCKFFLQGTCKYGSSCRFDHQLNDHNYGSNSSILLQNYANKPTQGGSSVDLNTLIKAVVNDMVGAEKGGQWLLSSYAPFRDKPAFPGFEDYSMEEIRYQFYEAVKCGAVEQFKQNIQMLLQKAVMKIRVLQNPPPDAVNTLKIIYSTPPSQAIINQTSSGRAPANQTLGSFPSQQSVFGNLNSASNLQHQSVFNGGNSILGRQSVANSNFAMGSLLSKPVTPMQSIFGQPMPTVPQSVMPQPAPSPGQAAFNQFQQQNSSPFGQPQTYGHSQPSHSIFGNPQATVSNSPFGVNSTGNPQGTVGNAPFGGNPTGNPQATVSNTPFGANSTGNPRGTVGNTPFGGNPTGNPQATVSSSPFGGNSTGNPRGTVSNTPFGGNPTGSAQAMVSNTPFGGNSVVNPQISQYPFTNQTQLQSQTNVFQEIPNVQVQNKSIQPNSIFNAARQNTESAISNTLTQSTNLQSLIGNNKPAVQHSSSIFGNFATQNTNVQLTAATAPMKPNEKFYSKMEDLSEDDIKWFQSDDLDISHIPEAPPTYEMCFKR